MKTKLPETFEPVDQDELQLKDEMNKEWADSWKKEAKNVE